ncbi:MULTISPECIES: glycosyltransferase family 4 protein [unclassified Roseovarius]|jgi:glycosyltransferase involved in cell wall biosynthesis|uniref:glycosyltransferase family 4 protein n=1 Tax=unclassified Roseovarius TaxID=2614913 RepID=UPI00031EF3ED|nr:MULTISPECIES: glycosyltransferase family 4 protein [unclassified Roseovarius]
MTVTTPEGHDLGKPIYVVNPMGFDGKGPAHTCLSICKAAGQLGYESYIFGTRRRVDVPAGCTLRIPFSNVGSFLPYSYFGPMLRRATERMIPRIVPEGALVYVWPSLAPKALSILRDRGCRIAVEVINFHTQAEKRIIEEEMDREGLTYSHYVTPEKIASQEIFLNDADIVFSSNALARQSLVDYGCDAEKIVLTRYASQCTIPPIPKPLRGNQDGPLEFLFVGRVNLEKGVHHLLRGWKQAGEPGTLHLYGILDSAFANAFADFLNLPSVKLHGYSDAIDEAYKKADAFLFLSLAEGGPQVTVEAAEHGLPMVTSVNGGGRIAVDGKTALVVDPTDVDSTAHAIRRISDDADLRARLGNAARDFSREFTWEQAARERFGAMTRQRGSV